jgi:hypothetical protein
MKKTLLFLVLGLSIMTSCSKDEVKLKPEPVVVPTDIVMPFLLTNKVTLKEKLAEISTNIIETETDGCITLICTPTIKPENIFKTLTYSFTYNEGTLDELNFSYILNDDVKEEYKDKLADYLKNTLIFVL